MSASFCLKTVSPSLTNTTAHLHQSHDCSYYLSRSVLAHPRLWLYKNTDLSANTSRNLQNHISPGSLTFPAPEAWRFCGITSAIHLRRNVMFLLEAISVFLQETTLSDSHALDRNVANFTCQFRNTTSKILTTWFRCKCFLLSDTQINVRQKRYIMSVLIALIRRQEQGVTKSQTKFNWPTNQQKLVP